MRLVSKSCLGLRLISLALAAMCIFASLGVAQDEVGVAVALDRDTIGMEEHAILKVQVAGSAQNLPRPQMPTLPKFQIYSQGRSSNMSITNGKVEASVTYHYMLLPTEPGTFPIANIAVVYNNRRYKGNEVSLTVVGGKVSVPKEATSTSRSSDGDRRDHFLVAVVDNKKPYVNEQITFTLKFYNALQMYRSPELAEPTTTGFWTEIIGNKAPYYQKINNRTYKVIERQYALFPTQTGALQIGRAAITTTVATSGRRRDPFDVFGFSGRGEEITVRSRPINITVKALPTDGRPKNFTGTIGRFDITASPSRTEVEVNQPVSVLIDIKGVGNIKSIAEPTIGDLPDFRVYKASSRESVNKVGDKIGGTKTFEEVFIPTRPGDLEIPSITFNFFDPGSGRYRVVSTNPIRLKVLKTEGYIADASVPYSGPDQKIGAEARDIRFIKPDLGETTVAGQIVLHSPLYLAVNALPVLLFATALMVRRRREKFAGDIGYARSRAAAKEARRRLANARSLATEPTAEAFFAESAQALLSYVADKLNVSPHGLTTDRLASLLSEHGSPDDLSSEVLAFLNNCAFGRYAGAGSAQENIDKTLVIAEDLMVRIEGVNL